MAQDVVESAIEGMTVDQRLDLISRLWDSIPDSEQGLAVPQWHRDEIERRLAEADAAPQAAIAWEDVKARLRDRP